MGKRRNSGGGARNRQASSRGTSARTPVRPLSSFGGHVNRTGLNVLRGDSSALPQGVTMGRTRRRLPTGIHGNVVHGPAPVTMGATRKRPVVPISSFAGQVNRTGSNVPMGPSMSRSLPSFAGQVNRTGSNVPMGPSMSRSLSSFAGQVNRTGSNVPIGPSMSRSLPSFAGQVNRTGLNVPMGPSQNRAMAAAAKAGPRMSMPTKIGLGIGAAAAVGVLMNRSGSPSDRGRQSSYRY